jgi:hypothetical protein
MRSKTLAPLSHGRSSTHARDAARLFAALAFVALAFGPASAQKDQTPQRPDDSAQSRGGGDEPIVAAAPPLRYLPDDVRRQLDAEASDPKARSRLSIQLAEERLARAAAASDAERFEEATNELGVYEAIVADVIRYVQTSGRSGNKQRDLFKRIELALRAHVPRLETLRRGLPAAHAVYAKATIEFVRVQRDQALNAFYDDTVVPEPIRPAEKTASGERARGDVHPVPDGEKKPEQR